MSSSQPQHHCDHSDIDIIQCLNTQGADLMYEEKYDEAIQKFVRTLEMWETAEKKQQQEETSCHDMAEDDDDGDDNSTSFFTIDDCILYGGERREGRPHHVQADTPNTVLNRNRRRRASLTKMELDLDGDQQGFVYGQPIEIPPKFWRQLLDNGFSTAAGLNISLILILNVAMAHHICATKQFGLETNTHHRLLEKALGLYELAHEVCMESQIYSPQATIIISNNVGEIHRSVNNHAKHDMCLRHLLSTMMFIVDTNQFPGADIQTSIEWDGFLKNTSSLILQQNCASAA